jgi:hypothetical protein
MQLKGLPLLFPQILVPSLHFGLLFQRDKKESGQRLILCAVGPGSCFILIECGSCFILIECLTDKVMKTKQEITGIIKKNG